MPVYRSKTTTEGRNMASARALWRATGMKSEDFSKPIIAVANSFTHSFPVTSISRIWDRWFAAKSRPMEAWPRNLIL